MLIVNIIFLNFFIIFSAKLYFVYHFKQYTIYMILRYIVLLKSADKYEKMLESRAVL